MRTSAGVVVVRVAALVLSLASCTSEQTARQDAAADVRGTGGGGAGGTGGQAAIDAAPGDGAAASGGTDAAGPTTGGSGGTGSGGTSGAGGSLPDAAATGGSGGGAGSGGTGGTGASAPDAATCTGSGGIPLRTPLVTNIYTADPSAHVFDGKLYIYPSHDLTTNPPPDNNGSHFGMKDYHVLSIADMDCSTVVDHGEVLNITNVPWAAKQMWAPDAAHKNGTYYLYFPAQDRSGIFRIGVAISNSPAGPFTAQAAPIAGSYSIDPAVFIDDDGQAYLYVGGLQGGQLQAWQTGTYNAGASVPTGATPALGPKAARLAADMTTLSGQLTEISIVDSSGAPLLASDNSRRFYEGTWVHKYNGTYYLSYSTGDTHYLVYATGASPTGPFTYRGRILSPVQGWTTHHSIVQFQGRWWLFYHDSSLSGVDNNRSVKVAPLTYNADGSIPTITP